jgi:hypothetical protein
MAIAIACVSVIHDLFSQEDFVTSPEGLIFIGRSSHCRPLAYWTNGAPIAWELDYCSAGTVTFDLRLRRTDVAASIQCNHQSVSDLSAEPTNCGPIRRRRRLRCRGFHQHGQHACPVTL